MNFIVFAIAYPLIWVFSRLPMRILYIKSDFIYLFMFYIIGYRKKVVLENLKLSFPEKSDAELRTISKKFFKHFIDLIMEYDGETVIGEIKTAKQEVWDTRQSEMKSSSNHMLQLLTYMKLKNAKEGFFLYENKNTQEILIIPISMNEKNKALIENAFRWMEEVYDNFKNGDLPVRPAGATKSKMPCTYCPIKKECYDKSGPVGTVEIDLYEDYVL
mgnify:CR=1 FL=1